MSNDVRRFVDRAVFAIRRPDMAWRRFRGFPTIDITVEEIAAYVPEARVVVEAGALDGSDTVLMARQWPSAVVHAFEPVPEAFAEVVARTSGIPNIRCHQLALSDTSGPQTLFVSANDEGGYRPDSSSLMAPTGVLEMPMLLFPGKIEVTTITAIDWAQREGIDQVDIFWLDMQGMEMRMLRASQPLLRRTRAVVMEVTRQELYSGDTLYPEVIRWMRDQGFEPKIDRVSRVFGNILFVRGAHAQFVVG
jgi:FkbM family methyltransferase